MKCKVCGVEMFRDSVETGEDYKTYRYKCPNRQCSNYGYNVTKNEAANALEKNASRFSLEGEQGSNGSVPQGGDSDRGNP